LEDVKLTAILSEIVAQELVFSYANFSKSNKDKITKYTMRNTYQ
jgi:hypothetical protein